MFYGNGGFYGGLNGVVKSCCKKRWIICIFARLALVGFSVIVVFALGRGGDMYVMQFVLQVYHECHQIVEMFQGCFCVRSRINTWKEAIIVFPSNQDIIARLACFGFSMNLVFFVQCYKGYFRLLGRYRSVVKVSFQVTSPSVKIVFIYLVENSFNFNASFISFLSFIHQDGFSCRHQLYSVSRILSVLRSVYTVMFLNSCPRLRYEN